METAQNFKDFIANNGETIITTTKAVEVVDNEQILDVWIFREGCKGDIIDIKKL